MSKHPSPLPPTGVEATVRRILLGAVIDAGPETGSAEDLFALGLDSLGIMQLLVSLEQELGISLPAEAMTRQNLGSIRSICSLVESVLAHRTTER